MRYPSFINAFLLHHEICLCLASLKIVCLSLCLVKQIRIAALHTKLTPNSLRLLHCLLIRAILKRHLVDHRHDVFAVEQGEEIGRERFVILHYPDCKIFARGFGRGVEGGLHIALCFGDGRLYLIHPAIEVLQKFIRAVASARKSPYRSSRRAKCS